MSFRIAELVFDLWVFGLPIALGTGAALEVLRRLPARARYLLAIGGFIATLALPWWAFAIERNPLRQAPPAANAVVDRSAWQARVVTPADIAPNASLVSSLALMVAFIWLVGSTLLLTRELVGHARLRRAHLGLAPAPKDFTRALGWPASIPLLVRGDSDPLTTGLWSPVVVVPTDLLAAFPLPIARGIACHELAHARWRDPLVHAVLRVVTVLFWPSPAWICLRWVRREREASADAAALSIDSLGGEEAYVRALVALSRRSTAPRRFALPIAGSDIGYRVRRILVVGSRWSAAAGVAAVVICALGARLATPASLAAYEETPPDDGVRIVLRSAIVDSAEQRSPTDNRSSPRP